MTEDRSLSPAAEACLDRRYPSSQKGGTLIAEDVHDLATHEERLEDPGAYRPASCPRCGACLHIHDLRSRVLHGEPQVATEVVRFRCADRERCGASWQVLPAFLARYLWGSWSRVRDALWPAPRARCRPGPGDAGVRAWRRRPGCSSPFSAPPPMGCGPVSRWR